MASRILLLTPPQRLTPRVAAVPAMTAETVGVIVVATAVEIVEAVEAAVTPAALSKVDPTARKETGAAKVPVFFVYLHRYDKIQIIDHHRGAGRHLVRLRGEAGETVCEWCLSEGKRRHTYRAVQCRGVLQRDREQHPDGGGHDEGDRGGRAVSE